MPIRKNVPSDPVAGIGVRDCQQVFATRPDHPSAFPLQTVGCNVDVHEAVATQSLRHLPECGGLATRKGSTIRKVLVGVWWEHRILLCLAFGYNAIGGLVLTALGRTWPIKDTNPSIAVSWIVLSALCLGWQSRCRPREFRQALSGSRVLGAILVTALVVPTQITFQALKQSIGPVIGFNADPALHRIDVLLHGGMAWTWFEPVLMNPSWVRAIDSLYVAWYGLLLLFFYWAYWSSARLLRQRALIAFFLMWIVAGTATAWLASSAGPCYHGHVVAGMDPYEPLLARLDTITSEQGGLTARFLQKELWEFHRNDKWGNFAGISAMPSLHVAIAVLIALVAAQRSRLLGFLLTLYAAVIQIGSVILAWHYAVDGYVGALLAVLCWHVAGALVREPTLAATPSQSVEHLRLLPPAVKQSIGPPASTTI